jgi:hypothetical protein
MVQMTASGKKRKKSATLNFTEMLGGTKVPPQQNGIQVNK